MDEHERPGPSEDEGTDPARGAESEHAGDDPPWVEESEDSEG
jgi:hypothetical protein